MKIDLKTVKILSGTGPNVNYFISNQKNIFSLIPLKRLENQYLQTLINFTSISMEIISLGVKNLWMLYHFNPKL